MHSRVDLLKNMAEVTAKLAPSERMCMCVGEFLQADMPHPSSAPATPDAAESFRMGRTVSGFCLAIEYPLPHRNPAAP